MATRSSLSDSLLVRLSSFLDVSIQLQLDALVNLSSLSTPGAQQSAGTQRDTWDFVLRGYTLSGSTYDFELFRLRDWKTTLAQTRRPRVKETAARRLASIDFQVRYCYYL